MDPVHFDKHFKIIHCRSTATVNACQHLRFRAYCIENTYLPPSTYPNELEIDEYDHRSKHLLIQHKDSGISTATTRLVLANYDNLEEKFPIEHFDVLRRMKRDSQWLVPRNKIGEISRFAVSKTFRKRIEERNLIHGITEHTFDTHTSGRRHMADITLGLFKALIESSYRHGLTHWYALMEPALIRLFGKLGIKFNLVGPRIEFYGIRQPCIAVIEDVARGVYEYDRDLWAFATDEGRYYGEEESDSHSGPDDLIYI